MANRNKSDIKIKYLIQRTNEPDIVIEVPANWKLTFAQVNPDRSNARPYVEAHCVRVWEGEKLRAVFGNATGLRDLSIPLAYKVQTEVRDSKWEGDSLGNFEMSETRQIETTFNVEDGDVDF